MSESLTRQPKPTFGSIEEVYQLLEPVMRAIVAAIGQNCEVVLHDLTHRNLDHSIYAIFNGHVTGRSVGGPSTNLGLEVLSDQSADHNLYGYSGRTRDGRELISSSVYYRNHDGQIIAALCINLDVSVVQSARAIINSLLPDTQEDREEPRELISQDISSVLDGMIAESLALVGKPVHLMDKADRIGVLRLLEDRGAFHVKRAADIVALRLGVSRVTIYGYLDEIRRG